MITKDRLAYYKKGCENLVFTAKDAEKVDYDRMESITAMATADVTTNSDKRSASEFKNAEEYKFYQLSVYSAASMVENGLM